MLAELLGIPHATYHHAGGEATVTHGTARQARTGRRLVPARRDAAARAAHHPVRRQQAPLRHADGHQEGQDQADRDRAAAAPAAAPAIALARVYLPEKQKHTEMLTGTPAEIAAQLVEKLQFEVRVL